MKVIVCRDLTFSYPDKKTPVLDGLDMEISGPGLFSIFGFSGVGKTTLARLICGLAQPESGTIDRRGIGKTLYTHNMERLPGWLPVGEHLRRVTSPEKRGLLQELLDGFGLDGLGPHRFHGLSMGQKNRFNFLRYLMQDFDLLATDEVLANVDEPLRNRLIAQVKTLFPDKIFLYISHNVIEVARFSKHIFVLPGGQAGGKTPIFKVNGLDRNTGGPHEEPALQKKALEIIEAATSGRLP